MCPTPFQQILIVLAVLVSLPLVCRLLARLKLLPLAVYFLAVKLFFPQWAADHRTLCLALLAGLVLLTLARWLWIPVKRRRADRATLLQVARQAEQAREMGLRDDQYSITLDSTGLPKLNIRQ